MLQMRSILERVFATVCLLVLSPVFAIAALLILLDNGLPIFFRQGRLGHAGSAFDVLKFRTMRSDISGRSITASGDSRVTRVGVLLRRYKVDELPQLWNIVRGDMQFVGPRPEVPPFVDPEDGLWKVVLAIRPGLTDLATLVYRDEELMLAGVRDPEQVYRSKILPDKLSLSAYYETKRSLHTDLVLIALTARYSFIRTGFDAHTIRCKF
jgi:lipopolysaccharide/colanic/teichoic acid biosynthesis glycosyltransferase